MDETTRIRCFGGNSDPLTEKYHDQEWGVPVHDDRQLFEALTLESAQAGLSWRTILHKRENYREAFDNFEPDSVAAYDHTDRVRLMANAGIVRNRAKIDAAISNANRVLEIQREFGSFDHYIWQFTGYKSLRKSGLIMFESLPSQSPESVTMSIGLRRKGFRFVGPVICYSYMQAIGMVNDHVTECFRAPEPPERINS